MSKEVREYNVLLSKREVGSLAWDRMVKSHRKWLAVTAVIALTVVLTVDVATPLKGNSLLLGLIPIPMFLGFWWLKLGPTYKEMKDELIDVACITGIATEGCKE